MKRSLRYVIVCLVWGLLGCSDDPSPSSDAPGIMGPTDDGYAFIGSVPPVLVGESIVDGDRLEARIPEGRYREVPQ